MGILEQKRFETMMAALRGHNWNKTKAAEMLEVGWPTIDRFCKRYVDKFPPEAFLAWSRLSKIPENRIFEALEKNEWNRRRAAEELGIHYETVAIFCRKNRPMFCSDALAAWDRFKKKSEVDLLQVFRELHADELASEKGAGP
jgi:transcriptional regulator with GAF, ATPase, and Fis domain